MSADHIHELCADHHREGVFPYPHCGYCGDRMGRESMPQVWCDKCDKPSTVAVELTTGETAFRCSEHAWLIIAPRGQAKAAVEFIEPGTPEWEQSERDLERQRRRGL